MKYLLDTCVVSELIKKNPNHKVTQWVDNQDENNLFMSLVSIGELLKGIHKLDEQSEKKVMLHHWLNDELLPRFAQRIVMLDMEVIQVWGKLTGEAERYGKKLPVLDSLIAATAIVHKLVLVTRNTEDFSRCDVVIKNIWD